MRHGMHTRSPFRPLAWLGAMLTTFALVAPLTSQAAPAPYPSHPLRVILPFGVGGLADISIRLVAEELGRKIGQQVVVENKPGAGGIVAANETLNSAPDGYTLTLFANGTAIANTLFKLPYNLLTDFAPISTVAYFDLVLLTNAKGDFKTLQDVLDTAKKRQIVLGTINPGSTQNLSAELFKSVSGIDAMVVPYKRTPDVLTAVIRGDVDVMFESYAALKGAIDGGQVIPIAATGAQRSEWLPKVPTVMESGVPNYEVSGWNALFVPAGTPPDRIAFLNKAINEVVSMPKVKARLLELGTQAKASTPEEMTAILKRDIAKWAAVIKEAGIKTQQ